MKKLITNLAAFITFSASAINVVACGMQTKPIVNGKRNVSNEIKVTGEVNAPVNNEEEIGKLIFQQAIAEKKITDPVTFDMFEITDRYNLELPLKGQVGSGFMVLRVKDDVTDFTGTLIVHFNNLRNISKTDITTNVDISKAIDITAFDVHNNEIGFRSRIWSELPNKTSEGIDIPQNQSDYEINIKKITQWGEEDWKPSFGDKNKPIQYILTAKYIGKDNYSGVITFNFTGYSYYSIMTVVVDYDAVCNELMIDRAFKDVKQNFLHDDGMSPNSSDYNIEYIGSKLDPDFKCPPFGEEKYINILATPKDPSLHHGINIEYTLRRASVRVNNVTVKAEYEVTLESRLTGEQILQDVIDKETAANGVPLKDYGITTKDFDISSWDQIIAKNWPDVINNDQVSFILNAHKIGNKVNSDLKLNVKLKSKYRDIHYKEFENSPALIYPWDTEEQAYVKIITTLMEDVNNNSSKYKNVMFNLPFDKSNIRFKDDSKFRLAIKDALNNPGEEKIFDFSFVVLAKSNNVDYDIKVQIIGGYIKAEENKNNRIT